MLFTTAATVALIAAMANCAAMPDAIDTMATSVEVAQTAAISPTVAAFPAVYSILDSNSYVSNGVTYAATPTPVINDGVTATPAGAAPAKETGYVGLYTRCRHELVAGGFAARYDIFGWNFDTATMVGEKGEILKKDLKHCGSLSHYHIRWFDDGHFSVNFRTIRGQDGCVKKHLESLGVAPENAKCY